MYNFRYPMPPPPQFSNKKYKTKPNFKQPVHVEPVNEPPVCNQICNKSKECNSDSEPVLFEVLGIKFYFDDILLICILLFLIQEGIHDEYLFISLILLLLS